MGVSYWAVAVTKDHYSIPIVSTVIAMCTRQKEDFFLDGVVEWGKELQMVSSILKNKNEFFLVADAINPPDLPQHTCVSCPVKPAANSCHVCAWRSLQLCCMCAFVPNVVTYFVFLCHVPLCLHAAMTVAQTFTSSQCQHHLVSPYSFLPPQFVCKLWYCVIQLCNTTCIDLGFVTDFLCNELTKLSLK